MSVLSPQRNGVEFSELGQYQEGTAFPPLRIPGLRQGSGWKGCQLGCQEVYRALGPYSWERAHSSLQPSGHVANGGWSGELAPGPLGGREHCSPAGAAGVLQPPDSVLQSPRHGSSGQSRCPAPASPDSNNGLFRILGVEGSISKPAPFPPAPTSGNWACIQLCSPSPSLEKLL